MTQTYNFAFRPIDWNFWIEHNNKDWVLNPSSDSKELEKQKEKYLSSKNTRGWRIFKIEPVEKRRWKLYSGGLSSIF